MADAPMNILLIIIPVAVVLALVYYVHSESKSMLAEVKQSQADILRKLDGEPDENPERDSLQEDIANAFRDLDKQAGGFGSPIFMHVVDTSAQREDKLPPILEEVVKGEESKRPKEDAEKAVRKRRKVVEASE